MTERRVLMVALDGLDRSVLERAWAAGRLPNLKAFAETSHALSVRSDGERLEGTVWPTFATGTGPSVHGHHWFFQWIAEESAFVPYTDPRLHYTPFWKEAVEGGRRVMVFDLAYVLPVGHENERLYSGWGLQDEGEPQVHPRSFEREIRKRHGRSKVEKDTLLVRTPDDRLRLARRLRMAARQRGQVLLDLAARRDWDLMVFGCGEFHLGGHHLTVPMQLSPKVDNETAMFAILAEVDRVWPDVVRAAGEGCDVALFALHGMRPLYAYPEAVQGMLAEIHGKPPLAPPREDLLRRVRNLLPENVHRAIWLRLPASFRIGRVMQARLAHMDREHDRAFVLEGDCAVSLRVNLEGREGHGVAQSVEAALAEVWAEASRYTTEAGEPPFIEILPLSSVFDGPRTVRLPDGVLIFNPDVVRTRELTRDDGHVIRLTAPESRNGTHTGQGFCFFRPADDARPKRDAIDNLDFAPTLLERLGVTPADRLQGTPFL